MTGSEGEKADRDERQAKRRKEREREGAVVDKKQT